MLPVPIETDTEHITLVISDAGPSVILDIKQGEDSEFAVWLNESQTMRTILALATRYNSLYGADRQCAVTFQFLED